METASGCSRLYVGTYPLLRRDVSDATSGRNFFYVVSQNCKKAIENGSPYISRGKFFDSTENVYLCAMNNQGLLALALYETTYLRDVIERNHLRNPEGMKELVRVIASGIGSSTNPTRIANIFQSAQGVAIKRDTIKQYIDYLKDSFLIEEALRYDVKGRKYIGTETKYYFTDTTFVRLSLLVMIFIAKKMNSVC